MLTGSRSGGWGAVLKVGVRGVASTAKGIWDSSRGNFSGPRVGSRRT
jgi:hypothetical protein